MNLANMFILFIAARKHVILAECDPPGYLRIIFHGRLILSFRVARDLGIHKLDYLKPTLRTQNINYQWKMISPKYSHTREASIGY